MAGLHLPSRKRATRGPRSHTLRYNLGVPKRYCTSRAEWRLQPGKPAQPLSPHYRLDCDFGTGVITCWEDGGSEPIYVCESHAKQLRSPRKQVTDIRIVTPAPGAAAAAPERVADAAQSSVGTVEPPEIQEIAAAPPSPEIPASPEPAPITVANASAAAEPVATSALPEEQIEVGDNAEEKIQLEMSFAEPKPAAAPVPPPAPVYEPPRVVQEPKPPRSADSPARSAARDLAYGNPAKAMVDEAIWNLATGSYPAYKSALEQGKSPAQAAEAAGGQFAFVHRKIADYSAKLENLLAESKATIAVSDSIDKPLEQAVSEVIGNAAMSDSEKDAAIQQLGTLQEWVKQGVQGSLLPPARTQEILLAIGDRLNWGGASDVPEEFKPAYRALYGNLKAAIRAAVPESQNLHERLLNLYAAKSDLESR